MNRLSKFAIVVGLFAFLLTTATAEAGTFRRCRHRARCRQATCEPCYQEAPTTARICRVAEMMHHDGYCDYYCVSCPMGGPPLGWQGAHRLPVGGCSVSESCLSWHLERGGYSGDMQETGYRRLGSEDELLDWEATPDFSTANPNHQVANVNRRYVKYEKNHKPDVVFAQVTSFDYSLDAGATWNSFTLAFQIKERGDSKPEDLGKAKKQKEHSHKVKGITVLTHKNTLDRP